MTRVGSSDDTDDFEFVYTGLPSRPIPKRANPETTKDARIDVQPLLETDELLISITPPRAPVNIAEHVACDIVLVIDVSGSMIASADLPDQPDTEKQESSGLSVLDLVKHASRTILEKLNTGDRLAIVTFSNSAETIQGLLPMTGDEKKNTWERIEALDVQDCTNLWAGIKEGLSIFESTRRIGNVQRMLVLTDGVPNHMCPSQGYVKKLRPMLRKMVEKVGTAPTISTFGFGYYLRSALLRSIAEVGHGNFAFIPDAGMIGTVFVHAAANLFSTFSTSTEVVLECSNPDAKLEQPVYLKYAAEADMRKGCHIALGNLQYGQSRDVIVKTSGVLPRDVITATLRYHTTDSGAVSTTVEYPLCNSVTLSRSAIDYHISRHELCDFLATLSTKNVKDEHTNLDPAMIPSRISKLLSLISRVEDRVVRATNAKDDPSKLEDLTALLSDLKQSQHNSQDIHGGGQVSLALHVGSSTPGVTSSDAPPLSNTARINKTSYYDRWGKHYIPSMLHAHMLQICITFKDFGPLRYGVESPLFLRCRDELDNAFDELPAPKPSLKPNGLSKQRGRLGVVSSTNTAPRDPVRMSRYHNRSNPCFAGQCLIRMAVELGDIRETSLEQVRVGDKVWTKAGTRKVEAIVRTDVENQAICALQDVTMGSGELLITPWHPLIFQGRWTFPASICEAKDDTYSGSIYSLLLENAGDPDSHVIEVGGYETVTLGHGLVTSTDSSDVRTHAFFGNYDLVCESLARLDKDMYGRLVSGGIGKADMADGTDHLDYIFLRPEEGYGVSSTTILEFKARL